MVFSGYSGFLLQSNWLPGYNWSIAQSGVKHHIPNLWIRDKVINCLIGIHNLNMIYLDWVLTSWWVTGEYGSPILSSSGLLLVYSSSDHAPSSLIDIGDSGDLISIPTGSVDGSRSCTLDWISTLLTWSVVAVPDEGYVCNRSCTLDWISTLLTWSVVAVPDEGYICNRFCTLDWISTVFRFVFLLFFFAYTAGLFKTPYAIKVYHH